MANQSSEAGIRLVVGGGSLFGTLRLEDVSLNIDPATRPHVVGDIIHSPFRSAVFQQVYFERVPFTVFTGQNRQALVEAARILQPGGQLVVETGRVAPLDQLILILGDAGFTNINTLQSRILRITAISGGP